MRAENDRMKKWLQQNGLFKVTPKFLWHGSMKGCWRLYGDGPWTEALQNRLTELGFVDFDGQPLDRFSGNGGRFSVFPRLTDKYAQMQILYGTDDASAIY